MDDRNRKESGTTCLPIFEMLQPNHQYLECSHEYILEATSSPEQLKKIPPFLHPLIAKRCAGDEVVLEDEWVIIGDHSFSTFAKYSEKLTFLTPWYHGVENVSFSENFANVLNE